MPHIPERMCAVCRSRAEKTALFRIVKTDNTVCLDKTQKQQGRGVYLCKKADCIAAAIKKKSLCRALSADIPESFYEELKHSLNG